MYKGEESSGAEIRNHKLDGTTGLLFIQAQRSGPKATQPIADEVLANREGGGLHGEHLPERRKKNTEQWEISVPKRADN